MEFRPRVMMLWARTMFVEIVSKTSGWGKVPWVG